MGTYREGQKELHRVFVDQEKAYDKVPREEVWYRKRESKAAEKYDRMQVRERSEGVVRGVDGNYTNEPLLALFVSNGDGYDDG